MRYFFLLFLCINFVFCSFIAPSNADEYLNANDFASSDLAELFKNGTDDFSPLSNKNGIGNWVKTPYGKIRLLSRESGTKDLDKILMAVEVSIDIDKNIKEPILKLIQSQNVSKDQFFLPIALPLEKELAYKKEVLFPVLLTLEKDGRPVQASVELNVQYCSDDVCDFDSAVATLTVPGGRNYFTPFSSYIEHSFKFIPDPASDKEIQSGLLSDNTFWLTLDLENKIQNPTFLILSAEDLRPITYDLMQSNINKNKALFVFRTQENLQKKGITLFFSDKKQKLSITTKLVTAPIPQILLTSEKTFHIPFYLWVIFLLFSPALCLLLQQRPRNEIIARKDLSKSILGIIAGILCGIPIYIFYPYSILSHSIVWLSFGILLFAFLGVFSYPITRFGYGVLTAIVPTFAFMQNEAIPVPTTFKELTLFFCLLAALNALPFLLFLLRPYTLVQMGHAFERQAKYKLRFVFFLDALLFAYLLLFTLFR